MQGNLLWQPNRPAPVRLARAIAADIIANGVPVGTHLGLLPEVAKRYGISVPTLRKAITLLQEDGILVAREGRSGGLVVAAPPEETAVQAMHAFFAGSVVSLEHVGEARDLVDEALAERACRFADAEMLHERVFGDELARRRSATQAEPVAADGLVHAVVALPE